MAKLEHRQAHFIGVDIGQAQDHSSITVLARRIEAVEPLAPEPNTTMAMYYAVVMNQFPLQTPYFELEQEIARLWHLPEMLTNEKYLVVDATGVGSPVVENLQYLHHLPAESIIITSGDSARVVEDGVYHVSKSNLVTALIDIVQRKRLKIIEGVKDADSFFNQLDVFGYKVNPNSGTLSYEAMQSKIHDDLVISTALAVWYAERVRPWRYVEQIDESEKSEEYNPLRWGLEDR